MEKGDPEVLRYVALYLRLRTGMQQKEFGKACRVDQGNISRYELGHVAPPEESLRRMAATSGVPWYAVLNMIRLYTAVGSLAGRQAGPGGATAVPLDEGEILDEPLSLAMTSYRIEEAAAEAEGPEPEEARREAEEICAGLLPLPHAERRRLLGLTLRASRSWAVAEALSHASARAAAHEVAEALALAELALEVARRVPGEARRARTEGYCTGFLANVRRVATEFDEASGEFARTWELWRAGEAATSLPLAEWRLLDLEASLRRAQHRFSEALERLGQARTLCGGEPLAVGRILLKKERVFYQLGDFEAALGTLADAAPFVEASRDPRLLFALHFNTASDLCSLERYTEAAALLPETMELAREQAPKLDATRVAWLVAKVDAGEGRAEEAKAGLERVIQEFSDLPYEAALASLDLAVLFLKEGRTAEIKELAGAMGGIFQAKGIAREALAALSLFCEAAKQETATVELTLQVIAEVERALRSASPS